MLDGRPSLLIVTTMGDAVVAAVLAVDASAVVAPAGEALKG